MRRQDPPKPDERRDCKVDLDSILVPADRLRALHEDVVHKLAESMQIVGLLHPIVVRPGVTGGFSLVVGRHRYEAARQLQWQSIRASVIDDLDVGQALAAEIDENLIRAHLSPAERALHIGRRKELYEARHPETKHGGAAGKSGGGKKAKDLNSRSFVRDTAAKTGKARSTIARDQGAVDR